MSERSFIIILLFISLSFSAFLAGYFITNMDVSGSAQGKVLVGFTPVPTPTPQLNSTKTKTNYPKIYTTKKGRVTIITINNKKILETRLPDPILEWKDSNTLYLKSLKEGEAVTFILTLDGQLTQLI